MSAGPLQTSSTAKVTVVLPFECKRCGFHADAVVIGLGEGQGARPYVAGEASERESSALRAARENAVLTLGLAKCKRCGARDSRVVDRFVVKGVVAVLGAAAVAGAPGAFVYTRVPLDVVEFASIGLAVFAALFVYWSQVKWKWGTVASRVAFLDDDTEEEPPTGGREI